METAEMGKVLVTATVENIEDLADARRGRMSSDDVRRITVDDALIDTGATSLLLPSRMIASLGLELVRERQARTVGGMMQLRVYGAVRLTVNGRDCTIDVTEVADDLPVIIGQVPLEVMDWVVDMKGHRLIGNPAHGGEWMIEAL